MSMEQIMARESYCLTIIMEVSGGIRKHFESFAINRERGNPHLFIIMTCNTNRPSILTAFSLGAYPANIPAIGLRIYDSSHFRLKILVNKKLPLYEYLKETILVIKLKKR